MKRLIFAVAILLLGVEGASAAYTPYPFTGGPQYQLNNALYYAFLGKRTPVGSTQQGQVWLLSDDPAYPPIQSWVSNSLSAGSQGLGFTLKNGGAVVFDNTGLGGAIPDASDYQGLDVTVGGNADSFYSMANNYDGITASGVSFSSATQFDSITAYYGIASALPESATNFPIYKMDVWSANGAAPLLTGGFNGDFLSADTFATPGAFSVSYTGFDRNFTNPAGGSDQIWQVTYTLPSAMTLAAGQTYYFASSASVPEPGSLALCGGIGLIGLVRVGVRRWRKKS